jgi:16S rRNA (cytosine967-C5)-methyltransferase
MAYNMHHNSQNKKGDVYLQSAREVALSILYKIEIGEAYSNITLNKELRTQKDLSALDKSLVSQIVYGVTTWKITLDEIIKKYSSIKIKKISPWILNILRMGIYQICFLDKIPESAAVNESVKLAKRYGHIASSRFVNAVLRKIKKEELQNLFNEIDADTTLEETEKLAIKTSHPQWMVEKLLEYYDKDFVKALLDADNIVPSISIRVNTSVITRDELIKEFEDENIKCKKGNLPDSVILEHLPKVESDKFIVQDEAAQLVCLMLEPKENETILDMCASPGGKTTYIAKLMNNKGTIDAWDIHEHRVELITELCCKLNVSIVNASQNDATEYKENLKEKYDRILLDVPCSGLGVIRKKPDIKWTKKEEQKDLIETQRKILNCGAEYLKPDGIMMYSTCTILKEENNLQIAEFLKENNNFELLEEKQLFPNVDGTDGFYMAKLHKKK